MIKMRADKEFLRNIEKDLLRVKNKRLDSSLDVESKPNPLIFLKK